MKRTIQLATWKQNDPGWWTATNMPLGVCKERDGKWHSYAFETDTVANTPSFKTMRKAKLDAETRYKLSLQSQ